MTAADSGAGRQVVDHQFVPCPDWGCSDEWCHHRNVAGSLYCPFPPDKHHYVEPLAAPDADEAGDGSGTGGRG